MNDDNLFKRNEINNVKTGLEMLKGESIKRKGERLKT